MINVPFTTNITMLFCGTAHRFKFTNTPIMQMELPVSVINFSLANLCLLDSVQANKETWYFNGSLINTKWN